MKLQSINRYEAYKDSGVEWLGEVPAHWEVRRVQDLACKVGDGLHGTPNYVEASKIYFVNGNNLVGGKILITENTKFISEDEYFKLQQRIGNNAILMSINGTIGNLAFYNRELVVLGKSAAYINLKSSIKREYIYYFFQSNGVNNFFETTFAGTTIKNLSLNTIRSAGILRPHAHEQTAIANYLDTKTAQIDRQIDLLSQKAAQYGKLKQSLINETVTRGLDKTVPTKDSGVEWIGEVPAHWEVKRVKELGNLVLGKMLDNVKGKNTFYRSYLKSKNIGWLKVEDSNIEKMYFSLAEMKSYRLKKDDILLSEGGEVGKTCFWNDEIEECYIQNSVHKITICKNNSPRFFLYQSFLLGSIKYYDSIVSHVSIKHLTKEKLSRVNWVRPPFEEQTSIANYLDEKTAHIDRIVVAINSQIDKLKELRLTLINDVVTGKIKVV